jgi:hypothetical protein
MPNDLLPSNKSAGTVNPISGPAMYQGQGELNIFFQIVLNGWYPEILPVEPVHTAKE